MAASGTNGLRVGEIMSEESRKKPSLWRVIQSVAASLLGVQSNKNRERDFQHGSPGQYIVVGLIAVVLFILAIVLVVNLVLSAAGV